MKWILCELVSKQKMPKNPCSVATCRRSNNTREKGTRFFSFPKDDNVREEWIKRCFSNKPVNYTKVLICSNHFKPDDFEDEERAKLMGTYPRRLKRKAVPSLNLPTRNGTGQMLPIQTQQQEKRIPNTTQEESKDAQHQQEATKRSDYLETEFHINMESFIYEIRQRPEIWDVSSHYYSNREKKKKAWDELIDIFIDKKKPLDEEKEQFGQLLQSRWQSIRDTYSQDLKIKKQFGSKKRPVSKFFPQLSFLGDNIVSQDNTIDSTEPQDLSPSPSICLSSAYTYTILVIQIHVPD